MQHTTLREALQNDDSIYSITGGDDSSTIVQFTKQTTPEDAKEVLNETILSNYGFSPDDVVAMPTDVREKEPEFSPDRYTIVIS